MAAAYVCVQYTAVHIRHVSAYLHRQQILPSRAFPCRGVRSRVLGRAARQLSVFHRLDPSVGRQPCLHTPASLLIFIELTSLTELLEYLKRREKEGCDRRTNGGGNDSQERMKSNSWFALHKTPQTKWNRSHKTAETTHNGGFVHVKDTCVQFVWVSFFSLMNCHRFSVAPTHQGQFFTLTASTHLLFQQFVCVAGQQTKREDTHKQKLFCNIMYAQRRVRLDSVFVCMCEPCGQSLRMAVWTCLWTRHTVSVLFLWVFCTDGSCDQKHKRARSDTHSHNH